MIFFFFYAQYFNEMCQKIGVDPLASKRGFWAQLLGVGDFYYELGVQIVEVCLRTRSSNGGLIDIDELRQKLIKLRGPKAQEVSVFVLVSHTLFFFLFSFLHLFPPSLPRV